MQNKILPTKRLDIAEKSTRSRAFFMAGEEGFEPSAYGFGDRRSTSWAIPLKMVGLQGLEPQTDRLWAGCSNQLS